MDEKFVTDLLKNELDKREESLKNCTKNIDDIRNKMSIATHNKDYFWNKKDLDGYEKTRRELRGEISALRQAIAKLERSD